MRSIMSSLRCICRIKEKCSICSCDIIPYSLLPSPYSLLAIPYSADEQERRREEWRAEQQEWWEELDKTEKQIFMKEEEIITLNTDLERTIQVAAGLRKRLSISEDKNKKSLDDH